MLVKSVSILLEHWKYFVFSSRFFFVLAMIINLISKYTLLYGSRLLLCKYQMKIKRISLFSFLNCNEITPHIVGQQFIKKKNIIRSTFWTINDFILP